MPFLELLYCILHWTCKTPRLSSIR